MNFRRMAPHLGIFLLLASVTGVVLWIQKRQKEKIWFVQREQNAVSYLRVLGNIEQDFYRNDRDGNGVKDYWTRDVAGLRTVTASLSTAGVAIPVLPKDLAEADAAHLHDAPGGSAPFQGYYFKVLDFDAAGRPRADRSTTGFAFCAYPAEYGRSGGSTFVINEQQKVYQVETGGKPVERWAPDPQTWKLVY